MSLSSLFFRRSVGAFLVYDVSSMESFEAIEQWYQQILRHTDSRIIIMLIGNKKDKENREVPFNMALEYAVKNNFGLMEVSARHGLGIQEAFNLLVSQIYRSMVEEEGGEHLSEDPEIRNHLRNSCLKRTQATSDSVILDPSKHVNQLDQSGHYKRQGASNSSTRSSIQLKRSAAH